MKILVAYDGSNGARAALAAASQIAIASNAHVTVVHALNPLTAAVSVFAQTPAEALEIAIGGAKAEIHEQLLASPGIDGEVRIQELERGEDVADAVMRLAHFLPADFIAVGSSRAGTARGALLGSVAAAIIRKSKQPVILAHPNGASGALGAPWPAD
jgi:nucleotide-binding universal stress UspA family protein